eukprot:1777206-Alexandrium_andersonii.AAC.1
MPELYAKVAAMGKNDPEISLLSYLNGASQRRTVDLMIAALPPGAEVFSYEPDGFAYRGPAVPRESFEAANGG